MLIFHSKRFDRRDPNLCGFTDAFGKELNVPLCNVSEAFRIGEKHCDVAAFFKMKKLVCGQSERIFPRSILCPREHCSGVNTSKRRSQKPRNRKYRKASRNISWRSNARDFFLF